ncbi:ATP/GTP-binding protein [Leptolyngbya sp. FACHB-36]|nr:ATP/GTP-binding protein [Leptolyngbya sp. FACHB-36]MBD2019478.1 ATP/GTP-binding protein [Leptolyngbya sp. FACHB-36]
MEILRLVVTGTPGAGKSTFVRAASHVGVINTDRAATDETAQFKPQTTVAFDYGRVTVGSAIDLHIYGTPGQSRFNFMWDILIRRAHAYILLVAAHRPEDIPKAKQILAFMTNQVKIPMVIGITHLDCPGACAPEEVLLRLGYIDSRQYPFTVLVDSNSQLSVNMAINTSILALLLSRKKGLSNDLAFGHSVRPLEYQETPVAPKAKVASRQR